MTSFALKTGQSAPLVISFKDASDKPAAPAAPPAVTMSAPGIFSVSALQPSPDGSVFNGTVTAIKTGLADLIVDAVGAGPFHWEADGTVTLPLATKMLVEVRVG